MLQLTVPDMACAACADTITEAVNRLDPAAKVEANLQTKQVQVDTQATPEAVKAAISAAGYTITSVN
jgi:copper chaperone